MSEIDRITEIKDRAGSGAPNFTNGVNFAGSDSGISPHAHTEGNTEPSSPSNGDTWWDTDNDIYKVYMDNAWKDWLGTSAPAAPAWGGDRGIISGGEPSSGGRLVDISRFDITTAGNAVDFGDLTGASYDGCGVSSGARGVTHHGIPSGSSGTNTLDYFAPATPGNATDFGDRTVTGYNTVSVSSGVRGVFMGGITGGSYPAFNTMDYITIASAGNATDFGDLTNGPQGASATNNETRGVRIGGFISSNGFTNVMDYITIANTGNATDFGDTLSSGIYNGSIGNVSDNSRGVFAGGYNDSGYSEVNVMQYITIANTGNATDFGDLVDTNRGLSACSNGTTGAFSGGYGGGSVGYVNRIQTITIGTAGNATDFGDIVQTANYGSHGLSGAAS